MSGKRPRPAEDPVDDPDPKRQKAAVAVDQPLVIRAKAAVPAPRPRKQAKAAAPDPESEYLEEFRRGPQLKNPCPRMYWGKYAHEVRRLILNIKPKPAYFHASRAWNILGYPPPTKEQKNTKPYDVDWFHSEVKSMWKFLVKHDSTKDGHKARAYILDALNTLGYRLEGFRTSRKELFFHTKGRDQQYLDIEGPTKLKAGHEVDVFDYVWYSNTVPNPIPKDEVDAHQEHVSAQWQRLHRFQGFCAIERWQDDDGTENQEHRFFRGIPTPEGPDSLWHALSYWRGSRREWKMAPGNTGFPSIWDHGIVKGRIWTWFMQTVKDHDHVRFRDYWKLHYASIVEHAEYGTMSLMRSLYASPSQGVPAYPTWWDGQPQLTTSAVERVFHDEIFWVIADYFCTQIVVFYPNPVFWDPKKPDHDTYSRSPAGREKAFFTPQMADR